MPFFAHFSQKPLTVGHEPPEPPCHSLTLEAQWDHCVSAFRFGKGVAVTGRSTARGWRSIRSAPGRAQWMRARRAGSTCGGKVVRGACLGPRGQGMWQVGVEYRGKKYCPRIKLICSHFSLPLPFCMLDPLSGSNALRTNPQSSSWQLMQLTLFPGMRPVVMIFLTWKKPRGSKGHRALCCNVTQ